MNIFYVDEDPKLAAQALVDTHVVKMILESAQLLSTAHRVLDGKVTFHGMNRRLALPDPLLDATLYKEAYVNHPCAVWVRKSVGNYDWLLLHFTWLCGEYTYRFGRVHKCEELHPCLSALPRNLPIINVVLPVAQAMPAEYRNHGSAVENYRAYYREGKKHLHKWTKRTKPGWL